MAKGKSSKGLGSNLSLPKPAQTQTVAPKKDTMSGNIGNHMGQKTQFGPKQPIMRSGGSKGKSKIKSQEP